MAARIEIQEKGIDARATVLERRIQPSVPKAKVSSLVDVYTVDAKLTQQNIGKLAKQLQNPVTQTATVNHPRG
jgi:hypothetical protein